MSCFNQHNAQFNEFEYHFADPAAMMVICTTVIAGCDVCGHRGHLSAVKTLRRHSDQDTVRVGLFNSRSVTGKLANIQQRKLSIATPTQTWHDDAASPDLIACASPGFKLVEIARARTNQLSTQTNHGDVCLFYNSTLRARVIQLSRRTTFQVVRPTYTVQGSVQSSLWSTDPAPAALLRVSSTTYWSD